VVTLTFSIPDELDHELEHQSAECQISKHHIVQEALRRYLLRAQFRSLRARLVPLAQERGIHTEEDVFGTDG